MSISPASLKRISKWFSFIMLSSRYRSSVWRIFPAFLQPQIVLMEKKLFRRENLWSDSLLYYWKKLFSGFLKFRWRFFFFSCYVVEHRMHVDSLHFLGDDLQTIVSVFWKWIRHFFFLFAFETNIRSAYSKRISPAFEKRFFSVMSKKTPNSFGRVYPQLSG